METPKTLQAAILFFSDADNCIAYMVEARWPDGVVICPTCGRAGASWLANQKKWQCKTKHAKRQFSAKVGTIFEDSPLGLDKWLMASWMLANCKNGVSSYEIGRAIGVTQKSAWFMMHRIRLAMRDGEPEKIGSVEGGEVEVDETFIGGKPANMHKARRVKIVKEKYAQPKSAGGWTATGKTAVMGMFDRESRQIRAKVVPNVKRETLQTQILNGIHFGSRIYSDQAVAYDTLKAHYVHETVNHLENYVQGQVHTNCLENFWSLTKRNLRGTYVCVEPFHLDRYVDEQVFRFNNRLGKNDGDRLDVVIGRVVGKRLTYADLTGKTEALARQGETGAGEAF